MRCSFSNLEAFLIEKVMNYRYVANSRGNSLFRMTGGESTIKFYQEEYTLLKLLRRADTTYFHFRNPRVDI